MDIAMTPIATVRTPFDRTAQIPKGLDARHDADGVIELDAAFEAGLQDIEGFSHLYVLWLFHRAEGYDLIAHPPTDDRPHGVFATRSPQRPNPIGLTVVELLRRDGLPPARARRRHARRHARPRHQAVPLERTGRRDQTRVARGGRGAPAVGARQGPSLKTPPFHRELEP